MQKLLLFLIRVPGSAAGPRRANRLINCFPIGALAPWRLVFLLILPSAHPAKPDNERDEAQRAQAILSTVLIPIPRTNPKLAQ
jgi:hypothetical protein